MPEGKKIGLLAAVGLFLATVLAAIFVVKAYLFSSDSDQSISQNSGSQDSGAVAGAGPQIQVGILLSDFTATGPHRQAAPYGYQTQLRAMGTLRDPQIHLIPVVEPGTAHNGQLARILSQDFPNEQPVEVSRLDEMKKVDVLVATAVANAPDAEVAVVTQRVNEGMGLLERQFGYLTPGYNAQTRVLCGYPDGVFAWSPKAVDCEIVGNHPLLGDLSGHIGATISLIPNGTAGTLSGIPLIRVKDMKRISIVNGDHTVATGQYLYPLYVTQLGRGKIVGVGYTQSMPVPTELEEANHGRFYIHCVQWLSGNPLN